MLMPALGPRARAAFAETRADVATGKCAPLCCTFQSIFNTCSRGMVQVLLVHGARTCALMLCVRARWMFIKARASPALGDRHFVPQVLWT